MRDIEIRVNENYLLDAVDLVIRIPQEHLESAPSVTPNNVDAAVKVMLRQLGFKVPDASYVSEE